MPIVEESKRAITYTPEGEKLPKTDPKPVWLRLIRVGTTMAQKSTIMIDTPIERTSSCSSFASFMSGLLEEYEVPFKDMKVDIVDDNAKNSESALGSQRSKSLVVMQRRKSIDRWTNELEKAEKTQLVSVRSSSSCYNLSSASFTGASAPQAPQQQGKLRSCMSDDTLLRLPQRTNSPRLVANTRMLSSRGESASRSTNASWDNVNFRKPQQNGFLDLVLVVDNPMANCPPKGSNQRSSRCKTTTQRPMNDNVHSDDDDVFYDNDIEEIPLKDVDPVRPTGAARNRRRSARRHSSSSPLLQNSNAGRGLPRQNSATFPAMEAAASCMGLVKPQRRSSLNCSSGSDLPAQPISSLAPPKFMKSQTSVQREQYFMNASRMQQQNPKLSTNSIPVDTNTFSSATAASGMNLRNKAAALGIPLHQSKHATGKKTHGKTTGGLSRAASSVVSLRESRKKASSSSKAHNKRFINDPSLLGLDLKRGSRLS